MASDVPDDEPGEFSIDDPEELSQKKRINEILSRRERVLDARNEALDRQLLGEVSQEQALSHYQSHIESLILDLWTKFESGEAEGGEEYLRDEQIDTVMVYPPDDLLPESDSDLAAGADIPDPKEVSINGLEWFINTDPYVRAEFSIHSWNPPGEQTGVGQRHIPLKTLDKAFTYCLKFIDEAGIDADIADDADDAEFDYSDLLDDNGDDPE